MKRIILTSLLVSVTFLAAACGDTQTKVDSTTDSSLTSSAKKEQVISYLGQDYRVNVPTDKVVAASLEAMEDAVALGVQPIGAVSVATDFPSYLSARLGDKVMNVGNKFGPDVEAVTALAPDVILGSTKFDDTVTANLEKIAPTINISHQSADWQANLKLVGELVGKEALASEKLADYAAKLADFKENNPQRNEQKAVMLRVRNGELCVYGDKLYFNPMLYQELGFQMPKELKGIQSQTVISAEQFAKWDVDLVFVQFNPEENAADLDFLDTLKTNPIWKSVPAVQEQAVYYNMIDAGYQGGTYLSKQTFLDALDENF